MKASWLRRYISEKDFARIESSVKQAEKQTSAEIVAMVVRSSSVRGHLVPLIFSILFIVFVLLYFLERQFETSNFIVVVQSLGLLLLAMLISKTDWALRAFTTKEDLNHQVNLRAEIEFFEGGLDKTHGQTGILLMVSLAERRAVVLADKAIAKIHPPKTWDNLVQTLVKGIQKHGLTLAFEEAIQQCGELLKENFPVEKNSQDQIPNSLRIKE